MRLTDLLSAERVCVRRGTETVSSKKEALALLADLLADGSQPPIPRATIESVLTEREKLQSTGIGDGVAIPHGAVAELDKQCAALLIVPDGIDFDAIDGEKANLLFSVITPKRATGEHLKTLARISRLLRNRSFRERLLSADDGRAAFELIASEEGGTS
ncbi:PTS sugar transporter subunit IIA [Pendulispora rubella]|uniref:PTS sugar transporter subunit IIA n=1 Tax=Pendulispora rubella TaxID=2741070 RepID=A0ABZ2KRP4_9BACT